MAKDPAFLFYPNDYIGGTMGMTFEEKGAYIELLMMQFNRGHMTKHMIGQTVGQLWDKIQVKFIKDDKGLFYNERLEIEQNKRKTFTESRRNNKKGTNQYSKKDINKIGHMTLHMEDRDINDNVLLKKRYNEFTENLRSQLVYERLAMNIGIRPTDIMPCINEFIESCYGEFTLKTTKYQVEQYFMNWVKIEGQVLKAVNNQMRKNGKAKL